MEPTLTPGWIYVANVLTYNGYEGVKIGGTEGTRGTPQKRINEHLRSGKFKWFELIDVHPVADVWYCEDEIKGRLNGTISGDPAYVAPGFREVFTKNANPKMIAELVVNIVNGRIEKAEAIGAKYRQMAKEDDGHYRPYWPNRSGGRVATVQAGTNWAGIREALYWGFVLIGSALVVGFCLTYIKEILVGLFLLLCLFCAPKKRGRPRKIW